MTEPNTQQQPERGSSQWPWMIVAVLLIAIIAWVLFGREADDADLDINVTTPAPASAPAATPPAPNP